MLIIIILAPSRRTRRSMWAHVDGARAPDVVLNGDGPVLGAMTSDPDMVELMAHIGFDWFMIDQMFTGNDWSKTEMLIRTGYAAGITPVVRVQSNPWVGYDPRIAVDVTRACGIGAHYVMVSHSGVREVEDCARVSHDWHQKVTQIHVFDSFDEWESKIAEMGQATFVIPQPESMGAFEDLEATLRIPEVRIYQFAMTDASRVLTNSDRPDWYAKELWDAVDRAVALGSETGTVIGANTSYAYDLDEIQRRVVRLYERGVKMIMIQGTAFLFQLAVSKLLRDVKADLGLARG